ncbi:mechanosensitive ion channel family protein [Loktanella sp. IMCC34160]|uniref:DUF3772 domain-containing protein n=1 Tax=Loktanella sp. IMCC34160 TaxID=2510646 RepID=UPI00101DBEE3|nr:DUF3772 domain-containing protein [Loktanella sp. IMCC34160]RYG91888.1 mechanosensitive ion channel family protein [Loktanella sp. IMCC34160]
MTGLRTLWFCLGLALCGLAAPAFAQDAPEPVLADPAAGPVDEGAVPAEIELPETGLDYAEWEAQAEQAEAVISDGAEPAFILEETRAFLVVWRDRFDAVQNRNEQRLATIRDQIAALGPAPETGTEDPRVSARRDALDRQLARLRAPGLLAAEARSRANGMVGEIDRQLRDRQTTELTKRDPSPLNPAHWPDALAAVSGSVTSVVSEAHTVLSIDERRKAALDRLPQSVLFVLLGMLFMAHGRRWMERARGLLPLSGLRAQGVRDFVLSLGELLLPIAGIVLLVEAVDILQLLGPRGRSLLNTLPEAAAMVITAKWLARRLFQEEFEQALHVGPEGRATAARLTGLLGWALGLFILVSGIVSISRVDAGGAAALLFPVHLLSAVLLFRFGQLLAHGGASGDGAEVGTEGGDALVIETTRDKTYRTRIFRMIGRVAMIIAGLAPLAALIGFRAASEAALYPAVESLALIGALVLLQRLIFDIYGLILTGRQSGDDALAPVLLGFALVLLSLPAFALIWGARVTDLTEIWTRFSEGFAIGETRISPTDFITFAIVFAVGYTLTRLVQGTLRNSVLPKTRLDVGGQNAVVAGLGYVGIFLAALAAITAAGIDLSGLAIVAGALSVGIGFGLQNIVSNFVSGIILLIERPIAEGDWIEVGGQMGYVRDISVRSTRIETFDRTDVIVPNADLVSGQVTNWTRGNSVGRVIVPVGVAYGTDTARVAGILREIAEANPMVVMAPPPNVLFVGFGADSLDFEIRAILRDVNFVMNVKSEINHAIAKRFAEEGIEIPFAQRDIWLRNPEALRADDAAGKTEDDR